MIKALIMDVDGTLTNGKVYIGQQGEIMKAFDVKDGYGIAHLLPGKKIVPIIITGRTSDIVKIRAAELGIKNVYQGISDKVECLKQAVAEIGASLSETAYIGDDLNDFPCMKAIHEQGGLVGAPADAVIKVRDYADFVSAFNGGSGAVREFIEWLIAR
ncbi:MAG TPA: 3-deoxy-D-manno-octulosonate 8-phosphate phosphatase [Succinivibrionaceae bacterium]|nr:3-deoxy-D-manno-octulosonate 8-phosphate phosphatase [Succinivibrionaceae bacterium]